MLDGNLPRTQFGQSQQDNDPQFCNLRWEQAENRNE